MTKGAFLSFRNDLKASNPKKMLKQTKNVIKARGINKGEGGRGQGGQLPSRFWQNIRHPRAGRRWCAELLLVLQVLGSY